MIPTFEEMRAATCRWRGEHQGITYELSWHGYDSQYSPSGTWCYYIHVTNEQFYPEDWAKLRLSVEDRDFAGHFRRHWDYDKWA